MTVEDLKLRSRKKLIHTGPDNLTDHYLQYWAGEGVRELTREIVRRKTSLSVPKIEICVCCSLRGLLCFLRVLHSAEGKKNSNRITINKGLSSRKEYL